jgi:tRNA (guanine37-N1)-methyltransferase
VTEYLADEEISVGSFVLSGGEWAAGIVVDAVARLAPGVLGNQASSVQESFTATEAGNVGILDFPHYTRPAEFNGWTAPEVLLSGDHEKIRRWRRRAALEKTKRNRPDLLEAADLSKEDLELLEELSADE